MRDPRGRLFIHGQYARKLKTGRLLKRADYFAIESTEKDLVFKIHFIPPPPPPPPPLPPTLTKGTLGCSFLFNSSHSRSWVKDGLYKLYQRGSVDNLEILPDLRKKRPN